MKTKNDWLIVLLNDKSDEEYIRKALCQKLNEKEFFWIYDSERKMMIFNDLPEEVITKISIIISSLQLLKIVQIDGRGII